MEKIVCVAGPTASGKTKLAVELAKAYDGEVLSCDSMQIYRGMAIGTAAPTPEEMQGVVHHMIGVADPARIFPSENTSSWQSRCCRIFCRAGKPASCAAERGFMPTACCSGAALPPALRPACAKRWKRRRVNLASSPFLRASKRLTPKRARGFTRRINRRIIRALEVYLETGETISEHNRKTKLLPPKHEAVWIGLSFENRQDLYDRIDLRVERMLQDGLLDEIRALLASGISPAATAMQAIGYKEIRRLPDSGRRCPCRDGAGAAAFAQLCQAPAHLAAPQRADSLDSAAARAGFCSRFPAGVHAYIPFFA